MYLIFLCVTLTFAGGLNRLLNAALAGSLLYQEPTQSFLNRSPKITMKRQQLFRNKDYSHDDYPLTKRTKDDPIKFIPMFRPGPDDNQSPSNTLSNNFIPVAPKKPFFHYLPDGIPELPNLPNEISEEIDTHIHVLQSLHENAYTIAEILHGKYYSGDELDEAEVKKDLKNALISFKYVYSEALQDETLKKEIKELVRDVSNAVNSFGKSDAYIEKGKDAINSLISVISASKFEIFNKILN